MARKHQERRPFLDRLAGALDRVVLALSPARGMYRISLRQVWDRRQGRSGRDEPQNSGGGIDGAKNDRLYGHRWLISRLSSDSRLELDHDDLKLRSREIYLNDAMGGAVDTRVNNTVGGGFRALAKVKPLVVNNQTVLTQAEADRINERLEQLFIDIERRIAVDRRRSLYQLTRLADRQCDVDGEGLVVMSDVGGADQKLPLALEVVDTDRLETPPEHTGNPRVRMGIEYDAVGRITHYHIRRTHPYDTKEVDLEYDRVAADRVCHIFEPWLAGQSRGLPLFTRAMNDIRNAHDFEEATIISGQIEAMHAGFVTSTAGASRAAIGAGNEVNSRGQRVQEIEPGTVKYLDTGDKIDFSTPNRSGGTAGEFLAWITRRVAAAINFAYEFIAKDWRSVSFAGGRLVLTEVKLDCQARQKYLKELFLAPVWERFVTEAVILGEVDIDPRLFAKHRCHFLRHDWISPAFPYAINPQQEIGADIDAVDNNHDTLTNRLGARGLLVEEVFEQREWERAEERRRGIEPAARAPAAPPEADEEEEDEPEPALAATE